jgi:hypothetical protein
VEKLWKSCGKAVEKLWKSCRKAVEKLWQHVLGETIWAFHVCFFGGHFLAGDLTFWLEISLFGWRSHFLAGDLTFWLEISLFVTTKESPLEALCVQFKGEQITNTIKNHDVLHNFS